MSISAKINKKLPIASISKGSSSYYRIVSLVKEDLEKENVEVRILLKGLEHRIYKKEGKLFIDKLD